MAVNGRRETDKRVIRTKKSIKAALFKLLETKDLSSVTISELTALANVNRRTFYTHYRNITDILDEVEGDLVASLKSLAENFDTCDYEKSAYNMFIGLHEIIMTDFDYYFHLIHVDTRGVLMTRLKNVIKRCVDDLLSTVTIKRGGEGAAVSAFIGGGFFNLYMEWYLNPDSIPLEEAARLASGMVSVCVKNAAAVLK